MAISKTKLIEKIIAADATYTDSACKEMKVSELQGLLADIINEKNQPEPTVGENGSIVIPEALAPKVEVEDAVPAAPKGKREGGSKRDALYTIFDSVQEAGTNDFKAVAKVAQPETSDGVISSYLCYWRKDRNVAATRGFGNTATKKSNAEKVRDLIAKLYGEEFDLEEVIAELRTAKIEAAIDAVETAE